MNDTTEMAARALVLTEKNDYSLRVGASYAARESGQPLHQHDIYERARELQEI